MNTCPRVHPSRVFWLFIGIVFCHLFCHANVKAATASAKMGCVPAHPAAPGSFNPRLFACPNDPSKMCYIAQDGSRQLVTPELVNRTIGIGPAHGVGIVGPDGVIYEIGSECTPSGDEDRPARPGVNAGPVAQSWWDVYWVGATKELYRCNVPLPPGRLVGMPPPVDPKWRLCNQATPTGGPTWTPSPTRTSTAAPSPSSPTATGSPTSSPTVTSSPTATTSPVPTATCPCRCRTPRVVPPRPTAPR